MHDGIRAVPVVPDGDVLAEGDDGLDSVLLLHLFDAGEWIGCHNELGGANLLGLTLQLGRSLHLHGSVLLPLQIVSDGSVALHRVTAMVARFASRQGVDRLLELGDRETEPRQPFRIVRPVRGVLRCRVTDDVEAWKKIFHLLRLPLFVVQGDRNTMGIDHALGKQSDIAIELLGCAITHIDVLEMAHEHFMRHLVLRVEVDMPVRDKLLIRLEAGMKAKATPSGVEGGELALDPLDLLLGKPLELLIREREHSVERTIDEVIGIYLGRLSFHGLSFPPLRGVQLSRVHFRQAGMNEMRINRNDAKGFFIESVALAEFPNDSAPSPAKAIKPQWGKDLEERS